jgi:hypothetical protein
MSRKLMHTRTEKKANKSQETQLRIEPLKHSLDAKSIKGKEIKNQNQIFELYLCQDKLNLKDPVFMVIISIQCHYAKNANI